MKYNELVNSIVESLLTEARGDYFKKNFTPSRESRLSPSGQWYYSNKNPTWGFQDKALNADFMVNTLLGGDSKHLTATKNFAMDPHKNTVPPRFTPEEQDTFSKAHKVYKALPSETEEEPREKPKTPLKKEKSVVPDYN